jgi:hypothetical protein
MYIYRHLAWVLLLSTITLTSSCGGGSGGSSGDGTTAPGLSIDESFLETTVTTSSVDLKGDVFDCPGCPPDESAFGYCPAISCPSHGISAATFVSPF